MSGVVLRCPNCGTTKAAPGECDACHEAQVRYYCTNHAPGRWLDARACPQCGARFGESARPPAAPGPATPGRTPAPGPAMPGRTPAPGPATPGRTPAPAPTPGSALPPAPRPPYPPTGGIGSGGRERRHREPVPPIAEAEFEPAEVDPRGDRTGMRVTTWQDLLRAAARARALPRETTPGFDPAPRRRGMGGCLMRFVLLMVLMFILITTAPFLFGRALLQMFGFY
jgi:hypothetical protein